MVITGYHTSRKTSYNQWLATNKQNFITGHKSVKEREKHPNGRYLWQLKYVNTILIVLCMSNGLICAYIIDIHDKKLPHHALHDICCKQLEFSDYYQHTNRQLLCDNICRQKFKIYTYILLPLLWVQIKSISVIETDTQ